MIASIKSEFLKLLTIRSTYVATIAAFLFISFLCFYFEGIRGLAGSPAQLGGADSFADIAIKTSNLTIVAAVVAVLFMAHEYRYNLITYTLTTSNSRTKSLLAKIIVVLLYSVFYAVASATIGLIMYRIGLAIRGATLAPQNFDILYVYGRLIFNTVGFAMVGLLFTVLFRNLALSIVALFMLPSTVEALLTLLLKDNAIYLPFSALAQVIYPSSYANAPKSLSPGTAALVFTAYLIAGWLITWYLFIKRDAN